MTSKLDQTHYILIGVAAFMFMPQFLQTWESRSYDNTQEIERKVGQLEIQITGLQSQFGDITDDLKDIKDVLKDFTNTKFNAQSLARDFEEFKAQYDAENLRQWARINQNEDTLAKFKNFSFHD